jgi:hypothetical protein
MKRTYLSGWIQLYLRPEVPPYHIRAYIHVKSGLAIHRNMYSSAGAKKTNIGNDWHITHVPTGKSVVNTTFKSLSQAKTFVEKISKWADWLADEETLFNALKLKFPKSRVQLKVNQLANRILEGKIKTGGQA